MALEEQPTVDSIEDKQDTQVVSSTLDLTSLEPDDNIQPYTLGGDSSVEVPEYLLDAGSVTIQDNPLEAEELTLGQSISESSSFEEIFSTFGTLGSRIPSGYSPDFDYARELNKESHVSVFTEVADTKDINSRTLSDLNDDVLLEEAKSDLQVHLEETAIKLNELDISQNSKEILSKLSVEFTPLFYNRSISQILEAKQAEAWQSTGVGEKIDEAVIMAGDLFGIQERLQQVNTIEKLTGKEVNLKYYRSDVLAQAFDKDWDKLSEKDRYLLLAKQLETTDAVDKGVGVRSSLVGTMLWGDLNKAFTEGELGGDDWVSWVEAASAIPVVNWLVKSPTRFKSFVKAMTMRNNAYHNYVNGLTTAQELERDMEAVREFQKMFSVDSKTDNVETLIKENRVDTEVEFPLADLEAKASEAVTRGERKGLETSKKELGSKRAELVRTDVNKEARELTKNSKLKFKEAKKQVKARVDNDIADVDAQLKGIQAKIDKADKAFKSKQQLSREITKGTPRKVVRETGRTVVRVQSGKLMDVTAKYSPAVLKSVMLATDDVPTLEASAKALGYTLDDVVVAGINKAPEDVAEGINPTLLAPDTEITPNDVLGDVSMMVSPKLLAERNLKDVLSAEEQLATVESTFQNSMSLLSQHGHLRVDHSLTQEIDENTVRSVARIGASENSGYGSYDIAKLASKNMPEGNIKIMVKHPSSSKFSEVRGDLGAEGVEYYIQVEKDITFDAMDASKFTDSSTWYSSSWVNELFFEPVDKLDRNIVKAVSYLRNIDNSLVKKLDKVLEPFKGANARVRAEASKLLVYGDLNEVDLTLESASNFLGRNLSQTDPVWNAYGAVNRYYKEVGIIRNWRERAGLVKDGFKASSLKDSEGGQIFTRVMKEGEIKASIRDGQTKAWDAELKKEVDLKDYDGGILSGRSVMKTSTLINREGKSYNIVINSLSDLKELPSQVIPLRRGHVDLFYDDVGAVIKITKPLRVNGKLEKAGASKTLRLANSEKEALEWLDTVEEGSTLTNKEVLAREAGLTDGEDIVVSLSREAKLEAGITNSSWNGNVKPYNLRKRGEAPVSSISGEAQVMALEDRLVKTHNALSNRFARDGLDIIKQRWLNTYGEYLENPKVVPDTLDSGLVKDMGANARRDAQNILNYIHNQEKQLGFKDLAKDVRDLDSAMTLIVGNKALKPAKVAMTIGRWVSIYGRPMYQSLVNTVGVGLSIVQRDPIKGTASMYQTVGAVHGLTLTKTGSKIESNIMAKMYGFDDAEDFNNFLEGVRKSGVFSTAQLDNIIAGVESTRLSYSANKISAISKGLVRLPKSMVTISTDLGHLVAYRHAVKEIKASGLDPYKGKGRVEVDALWQDLTQRMNKSSTLATENNDYSKLIALFTQHVIKGWKDTVLQPLVKVATNKDISKNPSRWADSYQQAFISTAMNIALFGTAGLVGKNTIDKLGLTEEMPEVVTEGLLDAGMAGMTGQDMDLSSRVSFGDAVGMFFSLTELDTFTLNLLGAGDIALTKIGKFSNTIKTMYNTPFADEQELFEFARFAGSEGVSIFAGYSDARKARMIKAWGLYFNNSGMPTMQVDPDSWIATVFSFTPDRVQEFSSVLYGSDSIEEKDSDYLMKDLPNMFTRYAYYRMIREEDSTEEGLTWGKYQSILDSCVRLSEGFLSNIGADNLKIKVKRKLIQNIIYPKDTNLDGIMKAKLASAFERVAQMHSYSDAKRKLEYFINTSDEQDVIDEATSRLKVLENTKEIYK